MNQRIAIVTGASSGIGLAITHGLSKNGYAVVAVARKASESPELSRLENVITVDGDVGDSESAQHAAQIAFNRYDRLDLLVNNAGIFFPKPFVNYTADDAARLISTNLLGFVHMTQQALPALEKSGSGHVVSISSSLTVQPVFNVPSALPIMIKGALETATRSLCIEYAERGVRFNTVSPGIIDTPMHPKETHDFLYGLSPSPRLGTAAEIFEAVHYLDRAEYVSGEILHVDGGAHAGKWS